MKKITALALSLLMIFSLTACGGQKGGDDGEQTLIVLGDHQALYKGFRLSQNSDGEDVLIATYDYTNKSKEENSFAWAFFYIATQDGVELGSPYYEENGESLTQFMEQNVKPGDTLEVNLVLALENLTSDVVIDFFDIAETTHQTQVIQLSEDGQSSENGQSSEPETLTAYQAYWNGDWYGWMVYSNGTNDYSSLDGFAWDCMARIEIDENGEGGMILWDEATSVDDPRAGVMVCISDGGFEQGRLKSEDGWFSDGDVGDADWLVEPDGLGYENLICIEGSYTDPEDSFSGYDYTIYLRPWGLDWADIEEDQPNGLPDHYYDWYLPAIQSGADMPDVIGGDYGSLASGEVSDSQTESQGAGGLTPVGKTELVGIVLPNGFSYNSEWYCYSDSGFTVAVWLSDAQTFTDGSEFQNAVSLKTVTKTLTLGGHTVYMCEDPENFVGPSTLYYVELNGEGGCAGCRITVSSMASDISATQTSAIQNMIASIAALK